MCLHFVQKYTTCGTNTIHCSRTLLYQYHGCSSKRTKQCLGILMEFVTIHATNMKCNFSRKWTNVKMLCYTLKISKTGLTNLLLKKSHKILWWLMSCKITCHIGPCMRNFSQLSDDIALCHHHQTHYTDCTLLPISLNPLVNQRHPKQRIHWWNCLSLYSFAKLIYDSYKKIKCMVSGYLVGNFFFVVYQYNDR